MTPNFFQPELSSKTGRRDDSLEQHCIQFFTWSAHPGASGHVLCASQVPGWCWAEMGQQDLVSVLTELFKRKTDTKYLMTNNELIRDRKYYEGQNDVTRRKGENRKMVPPKWHAFISFNRIIYYYHPISFPQIKRCRKGGEKKKKRHTASVKGKILILGWVQA